MAVSGVGPVVVLMRHKASAGTRTLAAGDVSERPAALSVFGPKVSIVCGSPL